MNEKTASAAFCGRSSSTMWPAPATMRVAAAERCTPAQFAIAWVLSRRDSIVPIVGTAKPHRLEENAAAAALRISEATLQALDEAFPLGAAAGVRTVPELLPRLGL